MILLVLAILRRQEKAYLICILTVFEEAEHGELSIDVFAHVDSG